MINFNFLLFFRSIPALGILWGIGPAIRSYSATRPAHKGLSGVSAAIGARAALVLLLGMGACSRPVPNKQTTLLSIQQMQDLATVEYKVSRVVKANDNKTWYKLGNRKILFTVKASVKAGINLAHINADDITTSGRSIRILLPEAGILSVNMPPQDIEEVVVEVDPLRDQFSHTEKLALLAQAERQIKDAAGSMGILEQARLNTQTYLTHFLLQAGYDKVELAYRSGKPSIKNQQEPTTQ